MLHLGLSGWRAIGPARSLAGGGFLRQFPPRVSLSSILTMNSHIQRAQVLFQQNRHAQAGKVL